MSVGGWTARPRVPINDPENSQPWPTRPRRSCPCRNPARPTRRSSATSASSPTSTTASRRWPTGCCSSPAWSTSATPARSTSTGWTSSASAASRSRARPSGCRGRSTDGADAGTTFVLNMIDTPGHVDFTYEVSRSLEACEGAVLLVDAAQGIEAQTLANLYLALDADLDIIPVLNKIDLPSAQPEKYAAELAHIIGCDADDVLRVSAKTGEGVEELLDEIVATVPAPTGRRRRAAARPDLRLGLRHLPRRHHLRPRRRRQAQPPRPDQDDVDRCRARDARGRGHLARADEGKPRSGSARSAT